MSRFESAESLMVDDTIEHDQKPQDECGVVGVWAPGEAVAAITYVTLQGLQHRGESAAGVYVSDAQFGMVGHKGKGRVSEAIPEATPGPDGMNDLDRMTGSPVAIGHVRYSTAATNSVEAAQPFGGRNGLAHNGHIVNMDKVARKFRVDVGEGVSDSHKLSLVVNDVTERAGDTVAALQKVLPYVDGAYCLSVTDGQRLIGARDPWGLHPLALGRIGDGYMLASEPVVFGSVGAEFVRDIGPGEIVVIDEDGISSQTIARHEEPRRCAYEYMYTGRVDGELDGVPVYDVRHQLGRFLAEDYPVRADVVVGMPESGLPAAYGYSQASGIPIVQGVTKNPYTGRSFLQRGAERAATLVDKARVISSQVEGRSVVLVDDSIIKGNSMLANVEKFRKAGAREIHLRIAAPPYEYPCHMGMDTGDPEELIARNMSIGQMCEYLDVDSIAFITPERVQEAVDVQAAKRQRDLGKLCMACSTGEYPFDADGDGDKGSVALGMPLFRRPEPLPLAGY